MADTLQAEEQLVRIEAASVPYMSEEDRRMVIDKHQRQVRYLEVWLGVAKEAKRARAKQMEAQYARNREELRRFFGGK